MRKRRCSYLRFCCAVLAALCPFGCSRPSQSQGAFQGIPVGASYSYHMSGRTDRVKGYLVRVDKAAAVANPGLVFLASSIDQAGEARLVINGKPFNIPPMAGDFRHKSKDADRQVSGKAGWYTYRAGDDLVAKFVVPLNPGVLTDGVNEIEFFMNPGSDGFDVLDARVETVSQKETVVTGQTYHLLARGRPPAIRDFDAVLSIRPEDRRRPEEVPEWATRGKVNFYRAGTPFDQTDRLFQMFQEARINLVAVGVPRQADGEAYQRVKAFIDRSHAQGIKIVGFNSLGNVPLRTLLIRPAIESWIARDEYGNKRWRQTGSTFAADLVNPDYRRDVLDHAGLQIDAGVDELYYDYAIGGTGDVRDLITQIRAIARQKGKNISIFGNCKGNILVDEACDLVKSEATREAGVWDGKWVHNIPQARFYYAAADGRKRYESKYEGADPGVANPGAYDMREGMKCGWKKPIAEASAFQSQFAIAEAGDKLLRGWIQQDHPLAVQSWNEIRRYFQFLDQNRELYTDVSTISKIGVLAPPLIPSFEASLRRESLYNALAEMNIMYDVLLLHRISAKMLSAYKGIIVTDIPWMEQAQFEAVEAYKRGGGKVYTIGSAERLRTLSDVAAPADLFGKLGESSARRELLEAVRRLESEPLVTVEGVRHVAANLVRKGDRFFLHLVNYDQPVKNVKVRMRLDGFVDKIDKQSLRLYSPDDIPRAVDVIKLSGTTLEFSVPALEVYGIVGFEGVPSGSASRPS